MAPWDGGRRLYGEERGVCHEHAIFQIFQMGVDDWVDGGQRRGLRRRAETSAAARAGGFRGWRRDRRVCRRTNWGGGGRGAGYMARQSCPPCERGQEGRSAGG